VRSLKKMPVGRTAVTRKLVRAALTAGQKACASKFIAEEMETGKYPRAQAVAIGISRARRNCR
jgi:dethiobiotin synthetase